MSKEYKLGVIIKLSIVVIFLVSFFFFSSNIKISVNMIFLIVIISSPLVVLLCFATGTFGIVSLQYDENSIYYEVETSFFGTRRTEIKIKNLFFFLLIHTLFDGRVLNSLSLLYAL